MLVCSKNMTEERWAEVEARLEETVWVVGQANRSNKKRKELTRRRARWELSKLRDCLNELKLPETT